MATTDRQATTLALAHALSAAERLVPWWCPGRVLSEAGAGFVPRGRPHSGVCCRGCLSGPRMGVSGIRAGALVRPAQGARPLGLYGRRPARARAARGLPGRVLP